MPKFTASDLTPGQFYRVIKPFQDYDAITHPVGEQWRFGRKSFLPYEDGLSLFVEMNGRQIIFRMQWRPETQGLIIDHFSDYVEPVTR